MAIRLRGHHLLCLLGYRGKGYSESFCVNMTSIYETLRKEPDTVVEIVKGPDDICRAFPSDQHPHCENGSVYERDAAVLSQIGAGLGSRVRWSELCERVGIAVAPGDIRVLCASCRWQPLGLCEEGVAMIGRGERLPPISS